MFSGDAPDIYILLSAFLYTKSCCGAANLLRNTNLTSPILIFLKKYGFIELSMLKQGTIIYLTKVTHFYFTVRTSSLTDFLKEWHWRNLIPQK